MSDHPHRVNLPHNEDRKWIRKFISQEPHFGQEMNKISDAHQKHTFFTRVRSVSVGSEGEPHVGSPVQTPPIHAAMQMDPLENAANSKKFYKELKSEFDFK